MGAPLPWVLGSWLGTSYTGTSYTNPPSGTRSLPARTSQLNPTPTGWRGPEPNFWVQAHILPPPPTARSFPPTTSWL